MVIGSRLMTHGAWLLAHDQDLAMASGWERESKESQDPRDQEPQDPSLTRTAIVRAIDEVTIIIIIITFFKLGLPRGF